MGTILEKIFKNEINNDIDSLNISFFANYFDKDLILKLIDIRSLYLDIFTSQRNKSKEERNRYLIKSELDKLLKSKNKIIEENNDYISKKSTLLNSFKDSINIRKLTIDNKLNELIIKNLNEIKSLNESIENKKKEYDSLEFSDYNRDLLIDNLKYKLNNLKDFDDTNNSYDKKDLYEDELELIINNKDSRMSFITYLFLSISLDFDNLCHVYKNANLYAFHAFKNERMIALENTSINLEYSLCLSLNEIIIEYIDIINNSKNDEELSDISKEMQKHVSIINTMIHFAKNHSSLSDDKDIKFKEYNMIKEYINDLKNEAELISNLRLKRTINNMIDTFNRFSDNL